MNTNTEAKNLAFERINTFGLDKAIQNYCSEMIIMFKDDSCSSEKLELWAEMGVFLMEEYKNISKKKG